jgi:hypothetical protein
MEMYKCGRGVCKDEDVEKMWECGEARNRMRMRMRMRMREKEVKKTTNS